MNHSFTLRIAGAGADAESAERIYAVITDATLSVSNGETHLDFDREAPSRQQAIATAMDDIRALGYAGRVEHG